MVNTSYAGAWGGPRLISIRYKQRCLPRRISVHAYDDGQSSASRFLRCTALLDFAISSNLIGIKSITIRDNLTCMVSIYRFPIIPIALDLKSPKMGLITGLSLPKARLNERNREIWQHCEAEVRGKISLLVDPYRYWCSKVIALV